MQTEVQMEDVEPPKAERHGRDISPSKQRQKKKVEVCNEIIKRLREAGNRAVDTPAFLEELHAHFQRLPSRYALDVNIERAEDVLRHKELLELAQTCENGPVFHVRAVHVLPLGMENPDSMNPSPKQEVFPGSYFTRPSVHPPPSFGSSANLEALALELHKNSTGDEDKDSSGGHSLSRYPHMPMHEVMFSTLDKPKLLSQLSSLLADVGLNIREAHVFSTTDGYSLDVFVVDGWPTEDVKELCEALETAIAGTEKRFWSRSSPVSSPPESTPQNKAPDMEFLRIPSDGTDDWEIDYSQLKFNHKVASGSFGDLFRGTYCGQDVAIKVLRPERLNEDLQREFAQEVYIMRYYPTPSSKSP